MAKPIITFEKDKLRLEASRESLLLAAKAVPGVNVSKKQDCARSVKDEMTCYFIMKKLNADIAPDVREWLLQCKHNRNELARLISEPQKVIHDKITLYPFQTSDASFMTYSRRCINGNEPGIGKTIEAICASDMVQAKQILVVCQKSLMYYWADEYRKWSSGDVIVCEVSSTYKRQEKLREKIDAEARIKIVSYSMLDEKKYPKLFKTDWDVVICDEAHYLKNPKAGRSQAATKLRAEYYWLLTGTTSPNGNVGEIYGLLHVLEPDRFGSYWNFCERYAYIEETPVWTGNRLITDRKPRGVKPENKEVFHRMLAPYMFVRKKHEVYKDLPEKIYQTIPIELTAKERKLYDALLKDMIAQVRQDQWIVTKNAMDLHTKLRQILLSPMLVGSATFESSKTDALIELLQENDKQVVVFACYKNYVQLVADHLNDMGISAEFINGSTPAALVFSKVEAFRQDDFRVLLGTYGKMSEGHNLQNADTLVAMDRSYVPKDNNQAENRIHRPGQTRRPRIINLVAQNTIDEVVEQTLIEKQSAIDEIESFQYLIDKLRLSMEVS